MNKGRHILFWALITVIYVLLRVHIVGVPLDRDEGAFGYIGQVIINHGVPYMDVFDHKPPLVFYVYAFALLIVPPTAAGIHLFLHAYNFLTIVSLFFLAKVYFGSDSAGLWTALIYAVFSASPAIQGLTASAEMFMLLPITLSLLLAVLSVRRKSLSLAFASGIFSALAFWMKQTAAFGGLFVFLYLTAGLLSRGNGEGETRRISIRMMLAWLAGGAFVSLGVTVYFYWKGVFREFFYWSFIHNIYYAERVDAALNFQILLLRVKDVLKDGFVPVAAGICYGVYSIARRDRRGYFTVSFVLFSLLGAVPGFAYKHYFAQIAPSVALAGGFAAWDLIGKMRPQIRNLATFLSAAAVILLPVGVNTQYFLGKNPDDVSRAMFGYNPFPESRTLADYIARRTKPDDRIFIFGSEPQILLYADRKSSVSSVMLYPLMSDYPKNREFQEMAWDEIVRTRPTYIVYVDLNSSIGWDEKADPLILRRLDQLVAAEYHPDADMIVARGKSCLISRSGEGSPECRTAHGCENPLYFISLYRRNF